MYFTTIKNNHLKCTEVKIVFQESNSPALIFLDKCLAGAVEYKWILH